MDGGAFWICGNCGVPGGLQRERGSLNRARLPLRWGLKHGLSFLLGYKTDTIFKVYMYIHIDKSINIDIEINDRSIYIYNWFPGKGLHFLLGLPGVLRPRAA